MRTRARAEDLANGGRSRGRAAVRGGDEADGWGLPSASGRERGGGGFSAWAGLGQSQAGRPRSTV